MKPPIARVERTAAPGSGSLPKGGFAPLVPELDVTDLDASLRFWCGLLGFTVAYDRPAAGFSYLERAGAQVMLCRINGHWDTGPLERPFGRGINFQIMVERLAPILEALERASWPLFEAPSETWYRAGDHLSGQREFLVQDPDGYLVRLAEDLGTIPAEDGPARDRPAGP